MSSEQAHCAHLRVSYKPVEHRPGLMSERWECDTCGAEFYCDQTIGTQLRLAQLERERDQWRDTWRLQARHLEEATPELDGEDWNGPAIRIRRLVDRADTAEAQVAELRELLQAVKTTAQSSPSGIEVVCVVPNLWHEKRLALLGGEGE